MAAVAMNESFKPLTPLVLNRDLAGDMLSTGCHEPFVLSSKLRCEFVNCQSFGPLQIGGSVLEKGAVVTVGRSTMEKVKG